jgi:hypothetical protein
MLHMLQPSAVLPPAAAPPHLHFQAPAGVKEGKGRQQHDITTAPYLSNTAKGSARTHDVCMQGRQAGVQAATWTQHN